MTDSETGLDELGRRSNGERLSFTYRDHFGTEHTALSAPNFPPT